VGDWDVMDWTTVVLWVEWSISEESSLFFRYWMVWVYHEGSWIFVMIKFWMMVELFMMVVLMMELLVWVLKVMISLVWESLMMLEIFMVLWDHMWLWVVVWWLVELIGVLTLIVRLHDIVVNAVWLVHWSKVSLVTKMVLNGMSFCLFVGLMDKRLTIDMWVNKSIMIVLKVILWMFFMVETMVWLELFSQGLNMNWLLMTMLLWKVVVIACMVNWTFKSFVINSNSVRIIWVMATKWLKDVRSVMLMVMFVVYKVMVIINNMFDLMVNLFMVDWINMHRLMLMDNWVMMIMMVMQVMVIMVFWIINMNWSYNLMHMVWADKVMGSFMYS